MRYRTIVADPPWPYGDERMGFKGGGRAIDSDTHGRQFLPYRTMTMFFDLVEQISPSPRLELFARRARFGWDYWGDESLQTVDLDAA